MKRKGVVGQTAGLDDTGPEVKLSEETKTELFSTLGDKNFRTLEQTLRLSEKKRGEVSTSNSEVDADGLFKKVWKDAAPPSYQISAAPHPAKHNGELYWPHQVEKDAKMPYKVETLQGVSTVAQWLNHYGKPDEEKIPPGYLTTFNPSRKRFGKIKSSSSDMRNGRLLK
mmetsp:Transcript_22964/g.58245  ORF Transcript_22964/g.58245 Transcript_22964/m.58245 type:complete len:169 (+) Transcript_22964:311-817(+)